MQEILDFLQSLDWSPLVISIKTGIVATILSFFFGIFAARAVMKLRPGARAVIDAGMMDWAKEKAPHTDGDRVRGQGKVTV